MALFDSYLASHRSYARVASKSISVSVASHGFLILAILAFPLLNIKLLPVPALPVEIFEAAPPPPPPPPGGNAVETKPKEEVKPKEPDALKEPDKVAEEMPKPDDAPPNEGGMEGGVEGGVAGGVVGGSLSDLPAKVLVKSQRKLSGDAPNFPPEARAQGLSATIAARVCISDTGNVTSVKILRGVPAFNDAVEKAVLGWRYEPYVANNTGVPACFPVYFNFNLKG